MSERETFMKNNHACISGKGYQKRINRCVYYYLVNKVCILIDKLPKEQPSLDAPPTEDSSSQEPSDNASGDGRLLQQKDLEW